MVLVMHAKAERVERHCMGAGHWTPTHGSLIKPAQITATWAGLWIGGRRLAPHPGPTWLGVMMDARGVTSSRNAAGISGRTYSRPWSPITGSQTVRFKGARQ